MNYINMLNDFYNNLSSDGLFFFWIVVFLFCFLVFLSIILVIKNKKLSRCLKEEYNKTNDTENYSISINNANEEEDIIIKDEEKEEKIEEIEEFTIEDKEEKVEEVKKEVEQKEDNTSAGLYQKNVLREINARMQTSPINIERFDEKEEALFLEEDNLSDLEGLEDQYEVNDSMKEASDIITKMEEEMKPSNIELTEYEKKQEEEAIISYEELLKVKDKIYNITDDEENEEFLDELKNFRLDLQ